MIAARFVAEDELLDSLPAPADYLAKMSCRMMSSPIGLSASVTRIASPEPSDSGSSCSCSPPSCGRLSPSPYHFLSFGPAA